MTVTALYHVSDVQSSTTLSTIINRLLKHFDPTPLGRWAVDHHLLRSNPASTEDKTPQRYQHGLRLAHHPGKAYFSILDPEGGGGNAIITIPADQFDSFYGTITTKLAALWSPRPGASVWNGVAYNLGDFVVRLGELRQAVGQQPVKGVVVCIQATPKSAMQIDGNEDTVALDGGDMDVKQEEEEEKEEEEDEDVQMMQALIRDLWKGFGVDGAKEMMTAPRSRSDADGRFEEVRLWCELLRSNR